ncbi:GSCOCG00008278001-RA-CDS [Cotesia congregata]|nr:GSCOCG00008278001-RA-CDS [Cotesia congregata]
MCNFSVCRSSIQLFRLVLRRSLILQLIFQLKIFYFPYTILPRLLQPANYRAQ